MGNVFSCIKMIKYLLSLFLFLLSIKAFRAFGQYVLFLIHITQVTHTTVLHVHKGENSRHNTVTSALLNVSICKNLFQAFHFYLPLWHVEKV